MLSRESRCSARHVSPSKEIRCLGGAAWQRLHRLVYVAAAAAVRFVMVVKSWPAEPLIYAGLVAVLLLCASGGWVNRHEALPDIEAETVTLACTGNRREQWSPLCGVRCFVPRQRRGGVACKGSSIP
jgi:DMSO/TMAO reductase YedYZ heme-binding membrane subunit